jgi:hypothetical protein
MIQDDNSIKTIDELMAHHYPPTTYLVDRLIPTESITILSGASRNFKTYTLLDIAISVASQLPLFEHFETSQANVLIINEEDGERLLQDRFQQLGIDKGDGLPIHVSALSNFKLEDKQIEKIIAFCEEQAVTLVIIDSLIRVHSSDENSAREMSRVFAQLRKFTKAGIAVLITQHHRKGNQHSAGGASEMRGSSDILAAVDSHFAVHRDNLSLTFSQEKQRYDIELDPFKVNVIIDNGSFKFEYVGTTLKRDRSDVLAPIAIAMLDEHSALNAGDFFKKMKIEATRENLKLNEHSFRDLLEKWIKAGYLPEPTQEPGKGNTQLYKNWEEPSNER